MSRPGQFLPPSFATAMEELASTPEAKAQPLWVLLIDGMAAAINGKRRVRGISVTGRQLGRPPSRLWAIALNRLRDRLAERVPQRRGW
jgi:hypothetical protein